ncbi:hypothetical protein [uncultured Sphingomonas sp.]|uniref:hypothetical protein n=1 Tax=uncultured Sphingomonas sp. TaxID=158754 RepID=UPI0035CA2448
MNPESRSEEPIIQGKLRQDFGDFSPSLSGTYQDTKVDPRQDFLFSVADRSIAQAALDTFAAAAAAGQGLGLGLNQHQ